MLLTVCLVEAKRLRLGLLAIRQAQPSPCGCAGGKVDPSSPGGFTSEGRGRAQLLLDTPSLSRVACPGPRAFQAEGMAELSLEWKRMPASGNDWVGDWGLGFG